MQEITNQIHELQRANNWQGMIQLLMPICQPDQWGWQEPELMSALGFAHSQMGNLDQAEQCYLRWIEIEPDRAAPFYCLGYIFYLRADWREAIRWFEQALKIFPDYLVCLYRLAYAYFEFNKARESIPLLERVVDLYRTHTDEDWQRRNRKNYLKSCFLLAKSFYRKRRYQEALQVIDTLFREDEKEVIPREHKYYARGKILAAQARYEEALSNLQKALHPRHPQPYVLDQIGRVYHQMEKFDKALGCYRQALSIRRFPYILVNRAETYLALGKEPPALRDLHEALKRDCKGKHKIYLRLGQISLNAGREREAKHYFESAIHWKRKTYNADYAEAHYALAQLLVRSGDKTAAKQELQTALEIDPNLEWDAALAEALGLPSVPDGISTTEVF